MGWGNHQPYAELKREAARAKRLEVERDAAIARAEAAEAELRTIRLNGLAPPRNSAWVPQGNKPNVPYTC